MFTLPQHIDITSFLCRYVYVVACMSICRKCDELSLIIVVSLVSRAVMIGILYVYTNTLDITGLQDLWSALLSDVEALGMCFNYFDKLCNRQSQNEKFVFCMDCKICCDCKKSRSTIGRIHGGQMYPPVKEFGKREKNLRASRFFYHLFVVLTEIKEWREKTLYSLEVCYA